MKKEEKTERTRERILKAATEEFGTNGYVGASLNTICETGISKGLLYHNFENKDAIYLACVQQCFTALTAYLREQNIGSDLHRYMDARLRYFQENEKAARLFFEAVLQPPALLQEQIQELKKDFDAFNYNLYRQMLSAVSLRPGVTQEEAMSYFALMQAMFNGYFSSPACYGMSFSDRMAAHEANLSKMFDFMLYGIAERRETK